MSVVAIAWATVGSGRSLVVYAVLAHMAEGRTNASIAGRLHVSLSAVEKHVNAIFDKLDLPRDGGYSRRVLAALRYLGG
jgi:DNA-binding NarL/FixJ family response regulator